MGRWAQKKRCGGGPLNPNAPANSIVSATIIDATDAGVTFAQPVLDLEVLPGDFTSEPSGFSPAATVGISDTEFTLQFGLGDVITLDTDLVYTGTIPNVQTPETIPYT